MRGVVADKILAPLAGRSVFAHSVAAFAASGTDPRRPMGSITMADRVRYEMFRRTGHFVTESSEHFAEYTPWFIKGHRPDLIERFGIPLDEFIGITLESMKAVANELGL